MILLHAGALQGADSLFGSVTGTRFPGSQYSSGESLGWQHSSNQGGILVGLNNTDYPIGSLTTVDWDGYVLKSAAFGASMGFSAGDARTDNHSSMLTKVRVAVDSQFDDIWSLHVADQYIDLNLIHGQLMTAGLELRPVPRWGVRVAGGTAVAGTLADRYGELAVNWYGHEHLFGGIVVGRSGFDPAMLGETAVIRHLVQGYVGASIPLPRGSLTMGADGLSLAGAVRETLRIGFVEPIK